MTTYNVSNTMQFYTALNQAVGGDSIILAGGSYGSAYLYNKTFNSTVTIKSASNTDKAHFDFMQLDGATNLRLEGLDVGRALSPSEPDYTMMMRVQNSTGISMTGMSFHGSLDNNPQNDGIGLYVTMSSNVQLADSSFRDLFRGSYFENNSAVSITGNTYHTIRSDGIDVGKVNGIVIDKNTFSDFHPIESDHPDAIQFWQVNQTDGSSNISITNNVVFPGTGVGTQGIWISDPNAVGYSNVLIQNNLLYGNDLYHGISVDGGHGVQILGNTVLSTRADWKTYWIQVAGGDNFIVKDNVTDKLIIQPAASGVTLSHNLDLWQTPSAASLFGNLNAPSSPHDLVIADYGYHPPASGEATPPASSGGGQDLGSPIDPGTSADIPNSPVLTPDPVPAPAPAPIYTDTSGMVNNTPAPAPSQPTYTDTSGTVNNSPSTQTPATTVDSPVASTPAPAPSQPSYSPVLGNTNGAASNHGPVKTLPPQAVGHTSASATLPSYSDVFSSSQPSSGGGAHKLSLVNSHAMPALHIDHFAVA